MSSSEARGLLFSAGLEATPHRLWVLERVLAAGQALAAPELLEQAGQEQGMNKVTLYRILDLLAAHGLLARSAGPERSFLYCAGGGHGGRAGTHGHFRCTSCGRTFCLTLGRDVFDPEALAQLPMRVERIGITLEGVCDACG